MVTEGIRLRIRRATEALNVLGEETVEIVNGGHFGRIEGLFDERKSAHVFIFRQRGELPQRLSVLLSEYAHHLRSSLDNLASSIAEKKGGNNAFPMYVEEKVWNRMIEKPSNPRRSPLYGLKAIDVATIKSLQPFQTGDPTAARKTDLAILNRISNNDKHDAIHACFAVVPKLGEQMYQASPPDSVRIERLWQAEPGTPLQDGTKMAETQLFAEPDMTEQVEVNPQFPLGISFRDDDGNVVGMPKVRDLWLTVVKIISIWDKSVKQIKPPDLRAGPPSSPG